MGSPDTNLLIEKFPPELRGRLLAQTVAVDLPMRTSIYTPENPPRYIHFLTSGIASLVTPMSSGDGIEVGLWGREAAPEAIYLLGPALGVTDCFVQVTATALRMDFKRFEKEFFSLEPVRSLILRQVQYSNVLTSQIAACNRLHEVEERLARWLLMVVDRIGTTSFHLTQEFLAEMIGSRRSTVTLTAGSLKRSGLIEYHRGDIHILDRESLEDVACECYPVTRKLLETLTA